MTIVQTVPKEDIRVDPGDIVNDFSITVSTINGSGSQTSNLTLLRSLFRMGIPVSGKIYSHRTFRDCLPGTRYE